MPVDQTSKLIGRLFEANVVGIFMWNLQGALTGANEAFLRMVKYDREDLASGRVRWTDLTPAEWRERDERAIAEVKASGPFNLTKRSTSGKMAAACLYCSAVHSLKTVGTMVSPSFSI